MLIQMSGFHQKSLFFLDNQKQHMNHMGGVRSPPGQNRKKCNYLIYFEAFHIKKKMGFLKPGVRYSIF